MLHTLHSALIARFGRVTEAGARACTCMRARKWACVWTCVRTLLKTGGIAVHSHRDAARLPVAVNHRGYWKAVLLMLCLLPLSVQALTVPGTAINNTASATFSFGATTTTINSNTATVTSTIIATPSTVTLYQYIPAGVAALNEEVPTQYASSGPPGTAYTTSANPVVPGIGVAATTLNPGLPVPLNSVTTYHTGEPVFVVVTDLDQNLNPAVQETVIVLVTSSTGDQEELLLTETNVDSGVFIGYVQSTSTPVTPYNGFITLGADASVSVNYTDQYDGSDNSAQTVLTDPFGTVFNSVTGASIDGISVSIVDSAGNPATVYGDDGVSSYPNVVSTGASATDSNGVVYNFPAGHYRFPLLAPGDYRIVVSVPPSLVAPSQSTIAGLQALPTAPFALDVNASFGNVFTLQAGPPLHVDIPVDPLNSFLVLDKSASKQTAAIGDFVQYTLGLSNTDAVAISNNTQITDQLPAGFRYQLNSVRVNGLSAADPVISGDARTLVFNVGTLLPGQSVNISYVTEVSASARLGKAVNSAIATDVNAVGVVSNQALASVKIIEDLFASHSFIIGRVINGDCAVDAQELPGFANARIYMEDGSYVVTDENGLYHFEGVTPGVHVVQLDKTSVPDNLEVIACEENTRFAGTAYSQFVDVHGGAMWRADFYVRQKDPIKDKLTLALHSELHNEEVKYSVDMSAGKVPVNNYRLTVILPEYVDYIPGSSLLDGKLIDEPEINGQMLVYRMGDLGDNWSKQLKYRARLHARADGKLVTKAMFVTDTELKRSLRSSVVENVITANRVKIEHKNMVLRAYFEPLGTVLTQGTKDELDITIGNLEASDVKLNLVIGHADSNKIRGRSLQFFSNNDALSLARAKVISDYLLSELNVDAGKVQLEGHGDREPIASNDTEEGRAMNRRAELYITTNEIVAAGSVELTTAASELSSLNIEGQPVYKLDQRFDPFAVREKLDINAFDEYWIKDAAPGTAWLLPQANDSPEIPAVNIAVKYNPANNYALQLNGEAVDPLFNFGTIKNKQLTVARVYWQGIHIKQGINRFEFIETDKQGNTVTRLTRSVIYSGVPVRAEVVEDYSRLIADGTYTPVIALRFYDADGNVSHPGLVGTYAVNAPYVAKAEVDAINKERIAILREDKMPRFTIGREGIALIELEPTTLTGKVSITLNLSGNEDKTVDVWLRPQLRDWILVGLAEGTAGYRSVSGHMQSLDENSYQDDFYDDGRIAFFAKGQIKGEWLLTTSYDTDKGKLDSANRVNQLIDPDTYYTIYGDGTSQRYDASSADKLYVKIERDQFYALYGDYATGLDVTELSKYSRRLTGFKSELNTDKYSYNVFAAENVNNFVKNEIRGDGTSGLYRLTGNDIVINSETIVIEIRDRFRSEKIIETRTLRRHLDYNIDYQDGTIYFREPIASTDTSFNPIYIIADYEVESPVDGDISAGGRAAIKLMDDKIELGASVVHDATVGTESNLVGADVSVDVADDTRVKMEVATTDGKNGSLDVSGKAYLAEVAHGSKNLQGRVYVKQQDAEFGLGQQSGTQSGTRKYGAEGRYRHTPEVAVDVLAYHEDNLNTNALRDVTEGKLTYAKDNYELSTGARIARDEDGVGNARDSDLLLLGASTKLYDNKIKLRANSETAVNSADESADFPSRYILGADYLLTPSIELFAENEWTYGADQDTVMTRGGARAAPWEGATVTSSLNREGQENGDRLFATLGMTQMFRISGQWTGDVAIDNTRTIRDPGAVAFNTNVPIAQGTTNDDFTAVSMGAAYHADTYTLTNRVETRNATSEHKVGLLVGWERKLIDGVGYAISTQLFDADRSNGTTAFNGNVRFSLGYRPLYSRWVSLNRLEYKFDEEVDVSGIDNRQRKLINNYVTNYKPNHENQLSLNYGVKYVIDNFSGDEFSGMTHLLGGEYRHDISRLFDIGVHAGTLYSVNSNNYHYTTGASVGFNLARNIWLSAGYNFDGFEDRDFAAAGYTAKGPYIQFRLKFDQDTAAEISNWLN